MRRPASAGRGSPLTPPLQGQPRELPRSTAAALPRARATTAGSAAVPVRAASASSRASRCANLGAAPRVPSRVLHLLQRKNRREEREGEKQKPTLQLQITLSKFNDST